MRRAPATCLLVLLVAGSTCRSHDRAARDIARCREIGKGGLRRPGLEVHVGSRIERDGTVRAGEVPACGDDSTATQRFLAAHDALEGAPPALRPERVVVHVAPALPADAPRLGVLEVHHESGSVLVTGNRSARVTRSMWLHEFAHLLMLGQKPDGGAAASLLDALEEGVADYYAACAQGSPALEAGGHGNVARDLRERPHGVVAGWDALALSDRRFDAHYFGWDLAARLWRRHPSVGPLLEDLLRCVSGVEIGTGPTPPRQLVRAVIDACPERGRDETESVLAAWLPRSLWPDP